MHGSNIPGRIKQNIHGDILPQLQQQALFFFANEDEDENAGPRRPSYNGTSFAEETPENKQCTG